MKKILTGILLTGSLLLASETFKEQVEKSYTEIQKMLPLAIDKETLWTKAEVKDNVVEYTFVLNKTDIDFTGEIIKTIETDLCKNPTLQTLLSHNYTNKIFYKDLNNKEVKTLHITKETCGYTN